MKESENQKRIGIISRLGQATPEEERIVARVLVGFNGIGKTNRLDDKSLIEYFVEGIPDSKVSKALLYQAEAYQKLRGSIKQVRYDSHFKKGKKETVKVVEKVRKCLNCGDEPHIKRLSKKKQ